MERLIPGTVGVEGVNDTLARRPVPCCHGLTETALIGRRGSAAPESRAVRIADGTWFGGVVVAGALCEAAVRQTADSLSVLGSDLGHRGEGGAQSMDSSLRQMVPPEEYAFVFFYDGGKPAIKSPSACAQVDANLAAIHRVDLAIHGRGGHQTVDDAGQRRTVRSGPDNQVRHRQTALSSEGLEHQPVIEGKPVGFECRVDIGSQASRRAGQRRRQGLRPILVRDLSLRHLDPPLLPELHS